MQFTVAIDYTASNGDPNMQTSLHYHDPTCRSLNQVGGVRYYLHSVIAFRWIIAEYMIGQQRS